MRNKRSSWMISPKSFIRLIGAEYDIMEKAGGTVLRKFYVASAAVFLASATCFISVRYAFDLLFHNPIVEVCLSLFFFLLFLFIYILLINTFTKEVSHKESLNLSNVSRIGFVLFMGFIMSKPIEIYFFKESLDEKISVHQQELMKEHTSKINALYKEELQNIQTQIQNYKSLNDNHSFDNEIHTLQSRATAIVTKVAAIVESSNSQISNSSFFIYRIKQVFSHYPLSWLICFSIVLLFLLPGYLIYSISGDNEYFQMKKDYERQIIRANYSNFEKAYTATFLKNFNLNCAFFTKYADAPFNKQLKPEREYKKPQDFFSKYCPE